MANPNERRPMPWPSAAVLLGVLALIAVLAIGCQDRCGVNGSQQSVTYFPDRVVVVCA